MNRQTKINQYKEVRTKEDADGNISTSTVEKTSTIAKSDEPDYIKLYTKTWCEFNEIPLRLRELFLELVVRMSYADSSSPEESQIVFTGKPTSTAIMKALDLKQSTYNQYLRELRECKAIRQVSRGVYQINPNYAGRGQWKYNPTLQSGGISDLKATFDFVKGTVDTKIIWGDDKSSDDELSQSYREGGLADSVVKSTEIKPNQPNQEEEEIQPQLEGQQEISDYEDVPF